MNTIFIYKYQIPIGELLLGSFENKLCLCDWSNRKGRKTIDNKLQRSLNAQYKTEKSKVISETIIQLEEYFQKDRETFNLPLLFIGTDLQKEVWGSLLQIPFGETKTYKDLSHVLNKPNAVRAIANAIGANPISIIIPCHRIIGTNGNLTGYAGGLDCKKKLLLHELKKEFC